MRTIQAQSNSAPPKENLVRALFPGPELRAEADNGMPTMFGHFVKFNEWAEINSVHEGRFMERFAPGSLARSFTEHTPKVLFQHGKDPHVGDKVLGIPTRVSEDGKVGGGYEVPLLDTTYNRDLIPGIAAGAYGMSFRFSVGAEDLNQRPEPSDYNPEGLPERTVTEASIAEFGPVTFPAYAGATAGLRSMTDEFRAPSFTDQLAEYVQTKPTELAEMIKRGLTTSNVPISGTFVPPEEGTETEPGTEEKPLEEKPPPTEEPPRAADPKEVEMAVDIDRFATVEALEARASEVQARLNSMNVEWGTREFSVEAQQEFDELREEKEKIKRRQVHLADRLSEVSTKEQTAGGGEKPITRDFNSGRSRIPDDIYDLDAYRTTARDLDDRVQLMRGGAMRSVEAAEFPHSKAQKEDVQGHIERLFARIRGPEEDGGRAREELAHRILVTGSPIYRRAFGNYLKTGNKDALSPEESRALSVGTGSAGGFGVVYTLDPTVVPTSNFSVNPYRAISRIETIAGTNEWKAVTSGAITAAYSAEAVESSDNAPTLAQPDIIVEKAQAFVPFSIEIGMDWDALQTEMASLLQDAKDDLEATQFTTGAGHGSNVPKGIITGATNTTGPTGGVGTFAIADLYKMLEALPPRFRPRAIWAGNLFTIDKVRQFDTAGGSGVWIDGSNTPDLRGLGPAAGGQTVGTSLSVSALGLPRLIGRPVVESTAMDSALTTTKKPLLIGDFRYFCIVDRIGMNVEVAPLLVGTNHRPTGQRGLYAYWRNSSDVLSASAFIVLLEP